MSYIKTRKLERLLENYRKDIMDKYSPAQYLSRKDERTLNEIKESLKYLEDIRRETTDYE